MVVLLNCFWKRHNVGVCIIPQPSKQDLSRAKSFGRAFLLFLANGGYIHWNHVNGENIWNVCRSHLKRFSCLSFELFTYLPWRNLSPPLYHSLSLSCRLQTWVQQCAQVAPLDATCWKPPVFSLYFSDITRLREVFRVSDVAKQIWTFLVSKAVSDSSKR